MDLLVLLWFAWISFLLEPLSIDLYLQYLYWCTVEYEIKDKSKWLFDDKYYLIVHGWILMYRKSKKWISPFFSILPNTVILQYSKRDYGMVVHRELVARKNPTLIFIFLSRWVATEKTIFWKECNACRILYVLTYT